MSREIAEEQVAQAKSDIIDYLREHPESTLKEMMSDFYPSPGYGKDIFGWAFWNLVNNKVIESDTGQVKLNG